MGGGILLVFSLLTMNVRVGVGESPCEWSGRAVVREGTLGAVPHFPWLGVLRVHLHHEKPFKIALTGIVLVKEKYAIGNADDVAKIPERIFKGDARAMFVPGGGGAPWYCRPLDYMLHHEYDIDTVNTIAIIELAPDQDDTFPMKPVCWPPYSYNTSQNLFVVGYTDENVILEKFILKLNYVEKDVCKQFYNRAGLSEGVKAPAHYECGFAPNNKGSCVWDNGMALVSNSSGPWVLVGLGVHGPGCSAPARFILLTHYFEWIESTTNQLLMNKEPTFPSRKSAFNEGFKKNMSAGVEYVPAHELLRSSAARAGAGRPMKDDGAQHHPYDVLIHQEDPFLINRVSGTELHITHKQRPYMQASYGHCNDRDAKLMYKELIKVHSAGELSPRKLATAQYRMSLHDSMFLNCTCITIKIHAVNTNRAYLYYDTIMEDGTLFPKTTHEVIRVYPLYEQTTLLKKGAKDHMMPTHIASDGTNITANNVNLYLKVTFQGNCSMEIKYYGRPDPGPEAEATTRSYTTSRATAATRATRDPYGKLRKNVPLEFEQDEVENQGVPTGKGAAYNNSNLTKLYVTFWSVVIFYEIMTTMLTVI